MHFEIGNYYKTKKNENVDFQNGAFRHIEYPSAFLESPSMMRNTDKSQLVHEISYYILGKKSQTMQHLLRSTF